MNLVSYNIQYGLGQDGRYDLERIAETVAEADVIALQEVDRFWQRSGMMNQPEELARHLPDHFWVYGANLDMDASHRGENGQLINRRRQFGTMLMSRYPILSSRNFPLPKLGLAESHSIQQGILEGVIATPGGPIRVYSTHLSHLAPETRLPQVQAILDLHARAPREGGAWCGSHPDPNSGWTEGAMPPMPREAVLMGDFNFEAGSTEYDLLTGPMTARYGRLKPLGGFVDAWVAAGHPEASGQSVADREVRIDHCLVSVELQEWVKRAWIDETAIGSDHFPLWVQIAYRL